MGNTHCRTNWCNYTLHSNGAKTTETIKKEVLRTEFIDKTRLILDFVVISKETTQEPKPTSKCISL